MSTVVERAGERARQMWVPFVAIRHGGRLRDAFTQGATFAATITPEQVEAAARAFCESSGDDEWDGSLPAAVAEGYREDYRRDIRAAFRAAGFEVPS